MLAAVIGTLALGQWLLLHRVEWRRAPALLGMASVMNVALLGLFWIGLSDPTAWRAVVCEDGPVEWATVALFCVAAGLYGVRAVRGSSLLAPRSGDPHRVTAIGNWGLAAFCVFVAGEEMSWGQRFFGFTPPAFFLENNVQQEFNAHNFLNVAELAPGWVIDSTDVMAVAALGFGLVAPVVLLARRAPAFGPLRPLVPTLPVGALFVATAAVTIWSPVRLAAEVAEFMLGAAFVMAALEPHEQEVTLLDESDVRAHTTRGRLGLWARGAALVAIPLALAAVFPAVIDRLLVGDESTAVARAEREAAALAAAFGANEAKLAKTLLHGRVFIALAELELDSAPFSAAVQATADADIGVRSTYFLDPWGNPYWLATFPRNSKFVVYSFGPNQRRDLEPRRRRAPVEDDIVVRKSFPSRAAEGIDLQAFVDALQGAPPPDDDTVPADAPPGKKEDR